MQLFNEILNDYTDYCHQKLLCEFGSYDSSQYDSVYLYQRYKCRIIDVRPRQVLEPPILLISPAYASAYQKIVDDITNGEPLKKYQSRNLKKLDYDDDMLSHWNIQHFHLGETIESDGFIKRSGDLLFIHFTETKAHIIGIFGHGAWCDLDIIEIMHGNWPDELSEFKTERTSQSLSEEEIKNLRKNNVNSTVTVQDSTEYINPGIGVTSNGAPLWATLNTQRVIAMFDNAFHAITQNITHILSSDPEERESEKATVGMEIDDTSKNIIYQIKETGFKFTLQSDCGVMHL